MVFTRTKHEADKVAKDLVANKIAAQAIHGDKSQGARQLSLSNFKSKAIRVLVATDIAARGIDIDELSHVINYNLPEMPENYVHRIGRTGRAGHIGTAISFCDYDEKKHLVSIQKLIKKSITVVTENPYPMMITTAVPKLDKPQRGQRIEFKDVKETRKSKEAKKVKQKKDNYRKSYANYI